jgi:succinoglycan biosynthesis protein ExoA
MSPAPPRSAAARDRVRTTGRPPSVSVIVPVLNEGRHLKACLSAIEAQTYPAVLEILVADGGSTDQTRDIALAHPAVRLLDNPMRIQAAGLNAALREAAGDVVVRVDGHCTIASDYIERCVSALQRTGAAMVGGVMVPAATPGGVGRAAALAMRSRVGAGPARFHAGGRAGWVDSVYLGCYPTRVARAAGGYSLGVGVNEDAELAYRLRSRGGVWFDPGIRASYIPRHHLSDVARQFFRYGLSRAATLRLHPDSLAPRQLAAPLLILGLGSPWRRWVALSYAALVASRVVPEVRRDPAAAAALAVLLPVMHLSWGSGLLLGVSGLAQPPAPIWPQSPVPAGAPRRGSARPRSLASETTRSQDRDRAYVNAGPSYHDDRTSPKRGSDVRSGRQVRIASGHP